MCVSMMPLIHVLVYLLLQHSIALSDKATWTNWSAWGKCTGNHSGCKGIQGRNRSCQNQAHLDCEGQNKQWRHCHLTSCGSDGGWSGWGPWSKCSETCGIGGKSRKRLCTSPTSSPGVSVCRGRSVSVSHCYLPTCPTLTTVSDSDRPTSTLITTLTTATLKSNTKSSFIISTSPVSTVTSRPSTVTLNSTSNSTFTVSTSTTSTATTRATTVTLESTSSSTFTVTTSTNATKKARATTSTSKSTLNSTVTVSSSPISTTTARPTTASHESTSISTLTVSTTTESKQNLSNLGSNDKTVIIVVVSSTVTSLLIILIVVISVKSYMETSPFHQKETDDHPHLIEEYDDIE